MQKTYLILLCLILLAPLSLNAAWKTMFTDNFMVYYRSGMEPEAYHALKVMEYYRPRLERLTGNTSSRTAIKLEDMGNLVNGYANPVGNVIGLYSYPPTKDELSYGEDWFQIVAPHEYIHKLQMTYEGGIPKVMRMLFGNILFPQLHQPMWMTEGITVYGESQLSPYAGRMNSAYYSALVSALAREDKLPSPAKAAYYSYDTPLAHYYVYGGSFHKYLAETYGEERFGELYQDNSSRITAYSNGAMPALALDLAFNSVYGKSLETLWSEWQAHEKAQAKAQTAKRITEDGWEKSDLKHYDNALYYLQRTSNKTGPSHGFGSYQLVKLELNGSKSQPQVILTQATDFPASYHWQNGKLYYSRSEYQKGFGNIDNDGFGSITELWLIDGNSRIKLLQGQIRAFLPLPDGNLFVAEDRELYRGSQLYRYQVATGDKELLYSGDALIHKIATDGDDIYVNAKEYWQNSQIYRLDKGALEVIIPHASGQQLLTLSQGKMIYNIPIENELQAWEYELKSKRHSQFIYDNYIKELTLDSAGNAWFFSTTEKGLDLFNTQLLKQQKNLPSAKIAPAPFAKDAYSGQTQLLGNIPVGHGSYSSNIAHLLNPRLLHLPIIEGTQDSLAVGAMLVGQDAVGDFPQYQISGVYDTATQKTTGSIMLENKLFKPITQQITLSTAEDGTLVLNQVMPLMQKQNYGLTSFGVGLGIIAQNRFQDKLLMPYTSQSFRSAGTQISLRNNLYWESKDKLQSERYRLGWQGQLNLLQQIGNSNELRSTLNFAIDPDADSDEVFYPLRGYEHELPANQGLSIRSSLYRPILKIRNGLWNPQLYVEDINLGFFFDAAHDELKQNTEIKQYSYGVELIAELFTAFNAQLNIGVQFGITKEKEQFIGLILNM